MTDTRIVASDLTCIVGAGERLYMQLLETGDNPCNDEQVTFTVNGASYNRTTDVDGRANLQINLPVGSYQCTISFNGTSSLSPSSKTVTVTVTPKKMVSIVLNKLFIKTYGGNEALSAWVYESDGRTLIKGLKCTFTINGVTYTRTSNSDGEIKLAVNLRPGEYRCVVDSLEDTTHQSAQENCTVRILSNTIMEGTNITKMEDETSVYQCAVYDFYGNRVQCNVDITVNGVTYTRHTDSNGLAKLNIRLGAGEYTITAKFNGDMMNNPSSVTNHISSKPYMVSLTTVKDGVSTPGENRGFMESKIYSVYYSKDKKSSWAIEDWEESINKIEQSSVYTNYKDVPLRSGEVMFTSYEITETDGRVKTARFTTFQHFDLTEGRFWVYISSPYHENFGGIILSENYDKNTGLYTYQCQDGRRQYISKRRTTIGTPGAITGYQLIESLLVSPLVSSKGEYTIPISDEYRKAGAKLLSGLHPVEDYDNLKLSPSVKADNPFRQHPPEMLSYDSAIDKILALSHYASSVDVYFTPDGVCHIDPINIDKWLNSGLKLTHSDLVHYKYSFDTTNIITGVTLKTTDTSNHPNYEYDQWKELTYYFGGNWTVIDPVTTQQQTTGTASSGDTTSNTSTVSFDKCGVSKDKKQIMAIGKPSAVGERHYGYTLYKSVFKNYCPLCKREGVLTWGYKWTGNFPCVTKFRNGSAGRLEGHIYCGNCDADYSCIDGKNHVSSGRPLLTRISGPVKSSEAEASKLSSGGYSDTTSTTTPPTDNGNNQNTTVTVVDPNASYRKAVEEVSKSVRDLLSFSIRVPLNSPIFKNLHTNMMLWTELPAEFELGNLDKIFKLMQSYKQSRGIPYVENRWYVEGVKTKMDSSGLFADITLNPFPSSYSVYTNAIKKYQEDYAQAFKQQEQATTTANNSTTTTGGTASAKYGTKIQNLVNGWIAGKTTDLEKAKAIHNGLMNYGIRYQKYYNFVKSGGKAEKALNQAHNGLNCGDTAVLTVACMRAAGLDAYVGFRCDHAHFFTVIVIGGTKYYSDLVWSEGAYSKRPWNDTWQHNKCHSKYNVNIY